MGSEIQAVWVCPATDQQLHTFSPEFFTMGIPKGGDGSCYGCGKKHKRPWGQYCLDVVKAKAHAEFQGLSEDAYRQFLFTPEPAGCTYEPVDPDAIDDRDGIFESFEEDKDLKLTTAAGGVYGQTQLEKDQAFKIAQLEAELDRLKLKQVTVSTPPGVAPGFQPLPSRIIPPNVPTNVTTNVTAMTAGITNVPVVTTSQNMPHMTASTHSATSTAGTFSHTGLPLVPGSSMNVSPAAYMAAASLQSQMGVTQPVIPGVIGQPHVQLQVQQPAKRKLAFFELDTFIPQILGPNHVYTIDEIVAASLALIEYRLANNMPIGGYHAHLRFLLERSASRVHKDQSLVDYDRFCA